MSIRTLCLTLPLLLLLPLSGCAVRRLSKELKEIAAGVRMHGTVGGEHEASEPIIITLLQESDETIEIIDYVVMYEPGPYQFFKGPGTYLIAAFEDRDEDFRYEPGEPAAFDSIRVRRFSKELDPTDLELSSATELEVSIDLSSEATNAELRPHKSNLGTLVSLDAQRFSRANVKMGLWEPMRFLTDVGAGVFFLEPYDPLKVPVIFVHGAVGSPADWTTHVEHLDRTRFQPWFLYYPTALDLDGIGRYLATTIEEFRIRFGFEEMAIVAHSMGGLISRHSIGLRGPHQPVVKAFITLSTPWDGHGGARWGARFMPRPPPSWIDMVPRSPFLETLLDSKLPPHVQHSLLFSYAGGSFKAGGKGDGAVTLVSQLRLDAQSQAHKVYGFHETHGSILHAAKVSEQLNAILAERFGGE